jgi:hypothetical protein
MSKQVTECSTPPDQDVEWIVYCATVARGPVLARTAWLAHQQVKGAPAFGSCRVVRVKGDEK